ncbi:serine/threonine protein kinase [Neoasaia chiangmaiensis NBRC 101099]|uniref:Uncharacterized protein n=1 Tax=Neoasaia chiangmaiensis TaxID=320497 RepID=A0A1U9KNX1_9PROT|nr:hypothetical protein [Neoasaia chiangmaiensis]AQS87502.1 hypothetical protein A0U93_05635 [Neoasaia chiangmaiensis]GBR42469.1 serine/threonine protein kinase [Neoasaia chiangmaiensis NBRC 101099]GEN16300.1 hypothetical protein NCH01_27310 [Neoasaia chiangmaiensis]
MAGLNSLQALRGRPGSGIRLAGRFQVSRDVPLPSLGGAAAFQATDIMSPGTSFVALAPTYVSPAFQEMERIRHPALLPVLTQERQQGALWVLTNHPPGPAIDVRLAPWREGQLIEEVIQPLAALLKHVENAGQTLRNIRPDNVFINPGRHQLTLGPLGVAMPGADQPVVFEALSSAVCTPEARGKGTIADDTFSLGVLVLMLCLGEVPLSGLSDEKILARRFELGTADAYMRDRQVPQGLVSVLQAMLSDDPTQRPAPANLINMVSSKMFSVRSEKRARLPLAIGGQKIRTARALAWQATRYPSEFVDLLKHHVVDTWLSRELQEAGLAKVINNAVKSLSLAAGTDSEISVVGQVARLLDPHAPLFRGGRWFWPQAIPAMLARSVERSETVDAMNGLLPVISQLLSPEQDYEHEADEIGMQLRSMMHLVRRTGRKGASRLFRLIYDANEWQRCLSPVCLPDRLSSMSHVLGALDESLRGQANASDQVERQGLLDAQIRAFLESQCARRGIVTPPSASASGWLPWLADLLLIAHIQQRLGSLLLPGIGQTIRPMLGGELKAWRSRHERDRREAQLATLSEQGRLSAMLDTVDDTVALRQDQENAANAQAELVAIEEELAQQPEGMPAVDAECRQTAQIVGILSGIGLSMLSFGVELCR